MKNYSMEALVEEIIRQHRNLREPLAGMTEFNKGKQSVLGDLLTQLEEQGYGRVLSYVDECKDYYKENR